MLNVRSVLFALLAAAPAAFAADQSAAEVCDACRVEKFATCGGFLEGMTVAPDGGLWALDVTGDRILNISTRGECVERGKTGGLPNGAKFHKDGRLFIAGSKGLLTFDTRTAATAVVVDSFDGKPLTGLNDLVFDANGGVYFTVPGGSSLARPNGRVFYLPPAATKPQLLSDAIAFPNGIAITADGRNVLVAEFAAKRILALPAPTAQGSFALTYVYAYTVGGVGADGMTVDSQGRLFAAIFGASEVSVFANDGRPLGSIRLPPGAGPMVTNLVVSGDKALYISEAEKGEIWRVRLEK